MRGSGRVGSGSGTFRGACCWPLGLPSCGNTREGGGGRRAITYLSAASIHHHILAAADLLSVPPSTTSSLYAWPYPSTSIMITRYSLKWALYVATRAIHPVASPKAVLTQAYLSSQNTSVEAEVEADDYQSPSRRFPASTSDSSLLSVDIPCGPTRGGRHGRSSGKSCPGRGRDAVSTVRGVLAVSGGRGELFSCPYAASRPVPLALSCQTQAAG